MDYTFATPPASRVGQRTSRIDEALLLEAGRLLRDTMATVPPGTMLERHSIRALFAGPLVPLCAAAKERQVPVEQLLVTVKAAWGSLGEERVRLGDSGSEVLAGVVTACIEVYFADSNVKPQRAD